MKTGYIVVCQCCLNYRGDTAHRINVVGVNSDTASPETLREVVGGLEPLQTRAAARARAKAYLRFPCRMVVKVEDGEIIGFIDRFGPGADWFRAINFGEDLR